jgi:hypothetical protein
MKVSASAGGPTAKGMRWVRVERAGRGGVGWTSPEEEIAASGRRIAAGAGANAKCGPAGTVGADVGVRSEEARESVPVKIHNATVAMGWSQGEVHVGAA